MKLKVQHVYDATLVISQIIREQRPMPQKGKYRLARMHMKLLPEFEPIRARRDEMIVGYGYHAPLNGLDDGMSQLSEQFSVPPDMLGPFLAVWKEIGDEEIEVDVEPIPLGLLDLGDSADGSIQANELITLGDLVKD